MSLCAGWDSYRSTPDYYNSCASYFSGASVPTNIGGFQFAATGNGYAGFYSYNPSSNPTRETIGRALSSTLNIGTKYFVSFKVSLCSIDSALCFNTATDHLGILFSTIPHSMTSPSSINNFAHVYTNTIITDTLNWTKVFGSFTADSTYQYLIIGNFFDDATTNKTFYFNQTLRASYYYVDDICVSTDSSFAQNWTGIANYKDQKTFQVFPNPASDKIYIQSPVNFSLAIKLFDNSGRQIKNMTLTQNKYLDTSDLTDGLYFVEIKHSDMTEVRKIVISRP